MIDFSEKDFLRGKVVEPAWYTMRIESVGEAPSSDGNSTNYPVEGTIIRNADNGSTDYANVPITWNFNSKAPGFAIGFLQSLGVDAKPHTRYDLGGAAGKILDVFVENKEWDGRIINKVNHKYRRTEQS